MAEPDVPPGDDSLATLWSIAYTILGIFFNSLSFTLMKMGHNKVQTDAQASLTKDKVKPFYLNKLWLLGIVSIIVGSALCVVGLGYGNQLMLASSSSLAIVFDTILAVVILKERLMRSDVIAISLICSGSVACFFFVQNDDKEYT